MRADAWRQQVRAAARHEIHVLVPFVRPREELADRPLVGARIVEDEHIARVDIRQGQRERMQIRSSARLDQHEIVVAESGREPLEPRDQARVLECSSNRQRCGHDSGGRAARVAMTSDRP